MNNVSTEGDFISPLEPSELMAEYKYKHGEIVRKCPTCRRALNPPGPIGKVDLDKNLCRCGKPLNSHAYKRMKNWVCERKERFEDPNAASQAAREIASDNRGATVPYECPFAEKDHPHYHVGQILKGII